MLPPRFTPDTEAAQIRLVVDAKLKQPAGMFLQMTYLGETDWQPAINLLELFDPRSILHANTADLRVFEGTYAQWRTFADQCRSRL